jgi:hypothetical protein
MKWERKGKEEGKRGKGINWVEVGVEEREFEWRWVEVGGFIGVYRGEVNSD